MALISLDDQLVQAYSAHATAARIPVAKLLERQLARFADTPITQRLLVVTGADLQALEQTLGGGALATGADLLARVHRWAGITIGDIRLQFSPAQLAEIAHRAEKQGRSPETIVREIVSQMEHEFFWSPVVSK